MVRNSVSVIMNENYYSFYAQQPSQLKFLLKSFHSLSQQASKYKTFCSNELWTKSFQKRMHSSRMRTAPSSSCLLGMGGVYLSACWDTHSPPRPDPPNYPLVVGLETSPPGQTWIFPPRPDPPTFPPGCGPGDL